MADAITTGNPVSTTKFRLNKRGIDIQGARVNQTTPRGRLGFRDTDGNFTLPRTFTEATKAMFPLDWAKPLNPPPYFEGAGLNGAAPYPMNDGSLDNQENDFVLDPDLLFTTPWPVGFVQYDIPPQFYDTAVTSGNKALVYDGGTFTYGSGNYVAPLSSYTIGAAVYAAYTSGDEGKITYAASGVTAKVGHVRSKEVFGTNTLTVDLVGRSGL